MIVNQMTSLKRHRRTFFFLQTDLYDSNGVVSETEAKTHSEIESESAAMSIGPLKTADRSPWGSM